MRTREDALREAIIKNDEETQRWHHYKEDQKTAMTNLESFKKHLSVDVMVPVGQRAFMPGKLTHTNEVLVGHYQGYFSKCSAFTANKIIAHRICMADDYLQKLHTEAEMWHNKLEKPLAEGVLASGEERDIIEEYDEEKEKQWRVEHRLRVKHEKLKEKQKRETEVNKRNTDELAEDTDKPKSNEELFKLLEEAELMEELENELDALEVSEVNDETIRKLISGEMKLPPEKYRVAHDKKSVDQTREAVVMNESNDLQGIVKKAHIESSAQEFATNNNVRPNPEFLLNESNDRYEDDESVLPEDVRLIKEQAHYLPIGDQLGFYEYQIEIVKQKLISKPLRNQEEINERIHLHAVLESLEELLAIVEETLGSQELKEKNAYFDEFEAENEDVAISMTDDSKTTQKKKQLSFALEDQTLVFRKNETIADMMAKSVNAAPKRDIITLNELTVLSTKVPEASEIKDSLVIDKKQTILDKVEQNMKFIAEHQSTQDFDMVDKILALSTLGAARTIHIAVTHSSQPGIDQGNVLSAERADFIPATPADLYQQFLQSRESRKEKVPTTLFINGYEGEDEVKIPVLREDQRELAYEDPRSMFSKPGAFHEDETPLHDTTNCAKPKSILCNKSAVENEIHLTNQGNIKKKKKKGASHVDENECMSAYNKVMNDVVEKTLTEPDALPDDKYIDAHAPKKRVSRFKQIRVGMQKM